MTIQEQALEATVVSIIAGLSALVAISTTERAFPDLLDLYAVGLTTALAWVVRFATLREYQPPPEG